jgi:hypothetical protein
MAFSGRVLIRGVKYWYTWKILKALGTTLYYIKYIFTLVGTCPEISVVIDTEWIGCGRHQVHDMWIWRNYDQMIIILYNNIKLEHLSYICPWAVILLGILGNWSVISNRDIDWR